MIQVDINSIDKTSNIIFNSLKIKNNIDNKVDECTFKIKYYQTGDYRPDNNDEVEIYDGSTKIFGGNIVIITERADSNNVVHYDCKAVDYAHLLRRRRVIERYENTDVVTVIDDIITNYASGDGFTTTNVVYNLPITSVSFNGLTIPECLDKLAELVNGFWYVDYDKDIHFIQSNSEPAPFGLTDTSANYIYDSLNIVDNITNLKNVVTVRGGDTTSTTESTEVRVCQDSNQDTYNLTYRFAVKPVIEVNSTPVLVGIEYIDDDGSFDVMWSQNERKIRFTAGNFPVVDDVIEITATILIPIIVEVPEPASISNYGEFEFQITDKTITTQTQAIDRALAELQAYANSINEGTFRTYTAGLRAGQIININSTIRDKNIDVLIQSVSTRQIDPIGEQLEYEVTFATMRTMGIIKLLQKILLDEEINEEEQETLLNFLQFTDSFGIEDAIGTPSQSSPPYAYTENRQLKYQSLVKGVLSDDWQDRPQKAVALTRERRLNYLSGSDILSLGTLGSRRVAQSFVAGDWSTSLAFWTRLLSGIGSPTGGIKFSIQADSAGSPSGTDLVSYSPTGSFITGSDFDSFAPIYQLTNGVTYWFVLDRLGTDSDSSYYRLSYDSAGVYGVLKTYDGVSWSTTTGSLRFAIDDASYAHLSDQISLAYNGGALFWRMKTTDTTYQQIFSSGVSASSAQIEFNKVANRLRFESKTNNVYLIDNIPTGITITDGEWHSFMLVFGASDMHLFVDDAVTPTWSKGSVLSDAVAQTYNYIGVYGNRVNGTYGRGGQFDIANVTAINFEPTQSQREAVFKNSDFDLSTWS